MAPWLENCQFWPFYLIESHRIDSTEQRIKCCAWIKFGVWGPVIKTIDNYRYYDCHIVCLCVAKITGRCDTKKKKLNAEHWTIENQWIITYCHRIGRVFGYWFDIISMSMFWILGRRRQRRCHDIDCYWMTCRICFKIRKKKAATTTIILSSNLPTLFGHDFLTHLCD